MGRINLKASDLRVGNLFIGFDGEVFAWSLSDFFSLGRAMNIEIGEMIKSPIPLTDEWLLKFGFEESKAVDGVSKFSKERFYVLSCEVYEGGETKEEIGICMNGVEPPLKFVHQLQNLYHSLTGQELELNK